MEKLRKNQERRLQRKNAKKGGTGDVFLPGGKKIKNETTVSDEKTLRYLSGYHAYKVVVYTEKVR